MNRPTRQRLTDYENEIETYFTDYGNRFGMPNVYKVLYSQYHDQLEDKFYYHRRPINLNPQQIFYVSDQLVDYIKSTNLGNGAAHLFDNTSESERINGRNTSQIGEEEIKEISEASRLPFEYDELRTFENLDNAIDLLINRRIANTPILIQLFYIIANIQYLKDRNRIHYTNEMMNYLGNGSNTIPTLNGQQLHSVPEQQMSGLDRLNMRPIRSGRSITEDVELDTQEEELNDPSQSTVFVPSQTTQVTRRTVPSIIPYSNDRDQWGIHQVGIIVLISYYRIHNHSLSLEQIQELHSDVNVRDAKVTSIVTASILERLRGL